MSTRGGVDEREVGRSSGAGVGRRSAAPRLIIPAHGGLVSGVAMCPTNPHLLAGCGFDGRVAVWDMRSPYTPLATTTKRGNEHKKGRKRRGRWEAGNAG